MNTEKKKEQMIEALRKNGGNVQKSVEAVGIGRRTHYDWLQSDADYRQAVEDIAESCLDNAEDVLQTAIKNGDMTATIFYLKTKGKKRGYSEKIEYEGKQQTEISIPKINVGKLPDDIIYKMVEAIDDAENHNE